MQSLKFALQPAVMNVSLVWDLPKEASVTVLSPPIISIFQGQRSLVYAQLSGLVREVLDVASFGFFQILYIHLLLLFTNVLTNYVGFPQSSTASEGHVTLNYSLAGELYQNKLHFSLKTAEDNR